MVFKMRLLEGLMLQGLREESVPQKCPSQRFPSRATSQLVVMTTDHGKARGVALDSWENCQVGGATGKGTTGTTTGRGALDGS
ncbi:hypothetical protein MTR67_002195 [Solanum verrucosum]|uniref:Uncharacterized protein n=1 Tax=Solanum verrucosum TaxID=315347 RepID=A0AAF0PRY4_SOLVR|nr:hypothetical protein MTR67_002195 [Solanum verrucosum]